MKRVESPPAYFVEIFSLAENLIKLAIQSFNVGLLGGLCTTCLLVLFTLQSYSNYRDVELSLY